MAPEIVDNYRHGIKLGVLRGKASPLSPVYSGQSIAVHKPRLLYEYFRPTPQG